MKEGVDAGAETVVALEVLTAPRGARECPYKAHVRIVSGSVVPNGSEGGAGLASLVRHRPADGPPALGHVTGVAAVVVFSN